MVGWSQRLLSLGLCSAPQSAGQRAAEHGYLLSSQGGSQMVHSTILHSEKANMGECELGRHEAWTDCLLCRSKGHLLQKVGQAAKRVSAP